MADKKLTELIIRRLKPQAKIKKYTDGGGLAFVVAPTGGRWWEYRFRFQGKPRVLSLGVYPDVSLGVAREKHQTARKQLTQGIDPAAEKKAAKIAIVMETITFREVAESWLEHRRKLQKDGILTGKDVWTGRLRNHILPVLGSMPIAEITSQHILDMLLRVKDKGNDATVSKLKNILNGIYQHAEVRMKLAIPDPMAKLRRIGELKRTGAKKHFRHADTPEKLGKVLAALESVKNGTLAQRAVWLAPRVFLRPNELCGAMWKEINLAEGVWRVDKTRMKMRNDHIVPLSMQVVEHLQELKKITGKSDFLFPSFRTKDGKYAGRLNPESLRKVLTDLGFGVQALANGTTTHGFRHAASTFLNEHGFNSVWIDIQLAHAQKNTSEGQYNHALYVPQRKKMMQLWSDYLDKLQDETVGAPKPGTEEIESTSTA